MNFFEHQERARRQTRRLIVAFVLAVLATVALIDLVVVTAVIASEEGQADPELLLHAVWISSAVVAGLITVASLWRIASLARGGGALARALGAVAVSADTQAPRLRRLRNVVEEMSIASGVPVPELYLLEKEAGINAFAAGFGPADAAICVTAGALDSLSRDELQGVIAHEFSHVLNGDMRLNLRLLGLLFGLLVLGVIGRHMMEARSGEKEGMAIAAFGVAIWLAGSLGLLGGRIIKASISRRREYLADASAVQFTRQTHGLVGALKKAAALPAGTKLHAGEGEEVAHMLFGDGVGYGRLLATHPPLAERIRRLDPQFNPAELKALRERMGKRGWGNPQSESGVMGVAQLLGGELPPPAPALIPQQVAALVGQTQDPHLSHARQLRKQMPPVLKAAARSVDHAPAMVLALLLDAERAEVRATQCRLIGEREGQGMLNRCLELERVLHADTLEDRLPLAQLCFPTLKRRPAPELASLVGTVDALVHVDGEVAVFEYALATLLLQLVRESHAPRKAVPRAQSLASLQVPVLDLLKVFAGLSPTPVRAAAYAAGLQELGIHAPEWEPVAEWRAVLDRALPELDSLDAAGKPRLVAALTATLLHDGVLNIAESELLRAVCGVLHCPLPPLVDWGTGL